MVTFTYIDFIKYSKILNKNCILNEEKVEYIYETKDIKHKHDKTFRKILDNKKEFTTFINKIFNLQEKLQEKILKNIIEDL